LALIVVVFLIVVVASPSVRTSLSRQVKESTRQLPSRYAELYFLPATKLPIAATVATGVLVSFAVHPHGWSRSTQAQGVVTLSVDGAPPSHLQTFTVSSTDASQTFRASFVGPSRPESFRLVVSLPSLRLSIYALGQTQLPVGKGPTGGR
jgi:hypothetical protein